MIRPIGDRVLVKPTKAEEVTASGILLPETVDKEKKAEGEIVAVGTGEAISKLGLKIGDKIITNSGIFGTVREILEKENALEIEVASGVTIKILRNFVVDLVKKDEDKKSKK